MDTVSFSLPENYSIERLPEDIEQKSAYGRYNLSFKQVNRKVLITRSIEILAGEHEQSTFNDLNRFIETIRRNDEKRIVLRKNET